jgi:hypothetical protein
MPTTTPGSTLRAIAAATALEEDPAKRLLRLRGLQADLDSIDETVRGYVRDAIRELRSTTPAATWSEIGEILGVTAARAEQLSR